MTKRGQDEAPRAAVLSVENIRRATSSSALVLDHRAVGRAVTLRSPVDVSALAVSYDDDESEDHHHDAPKVLTTKTGSVAIVYVMGPMAQRAISDMCGYVDGYDAITERFARAMSSEAESVLMIIDSPGGDAVGIEQAVNRMAAMKAQMGKPVVVFVDELAASGGYWLAAALGDEIVIPPMGQVGSIGCIGGLYDETGALEQEGIKVTLIRSPAGKAENHPYQPVTDLALERAQREVDEIAKVFFGVVASSRGISAAKVEALNADVLRGQAALDAKLADRIGTYEDALKRAASLGRREAKRKASVMALHPSMPSVLVTNVGTPSVPSAESFGTTISVTHEDSEHLQRIVAMVGASSHADAIGKIAALQESRVALDKAQAELASVRVELAGMRKELEDGKAQALIKDAEADFRVRPENRANVEAFYEKFGLEGLTSFLAALPPLPAAKQIKEPERDPSETPTFIAAQTNAPVVSFIEVEPDLSKMNSAQRRAFIQANGLPKYRALKAKQGLA